MAANGPPLDATRARRMWMSSASSGVRISAVTVRRITECVGLGRPCNPFHTPSVTMRGVVRGLKKIEELLAPAAARCTCPVSPLLHRHERRS